jgi:hypothetical protein
LPPASVSAFARSVANSFSNSSYASRAFATPASDVRPRLVGADRGQPLVDLGVDARHEERRDGVDLRQVVAVRLGLLETRQVGVDDLGVALQAEDERDIDRDALGEHRGDRRQAGLGRGDLDVHVGAVDGRPELLRLCDGRVGVVGEVG